ncbi:hypothetical protein K488DRAFT_38102, partial [Vararia minispora EC-137]
KSMRARFSRHARRVFEHGHRLFLFGIAIMPTTARLLRFDRTSTLFSEPFDWHHTPHLSDFFLRLGQMTSGQRGHDTSAM